MSRPHVLSAVVLSLFLCACDSRKDFSGAYEVSGVLTLTEGPRKSTIEVKAAPLVIIADAFDSDRLYLDFDCGMSATMKDGESFELDGKTCPSSTEDSCSFTWTFNNGVGSLKEDSTLAFDSNGSVRVKCSDGSTGLVNFSFRLKGGRSSGSESDDPALPGEQSGDVRSRPLSALQSAVMRSLRPRVR